jgi:hypothetical protein
MLARENVTRSAHIRGELVDFIDASHHCLGKVLIPKVSNDEFVGGRFSELVPFDIDSAYPEAFSFQPFHQVTPDESPGSID